MPSKMQFYAQMADRAAKQITASYQSRISFLQMAGRLYKYQYNEQAIGDDCGMIDGIINYGSKQQDQEKKPSIFERLRRYVAERIPILTIKTPVCTRQIRAGGETDLPSLRLLASYR